MTESDIHSMKNQEKGRYVPVLPDAAAVPGSEKRITWITSFGLERLKGELYSPVASIRYRTLIPAKYLDQWGHKVDVVPIMMSDTPESIESMRQSDIVVFSKTYSKKAEHLAIQAKSFGCRVVKDFCDNHFEAPQLVSHNRTMCELADSITVSTDAMCEVVREQTGRTATVIEDTYETPKSGPTFESEGIHLKLLWFGNITSLDGLVDILPGLFDLGKNMPLALHVVTRQEPIILDRFKTFVEKHGHGIGLEISPWSVETTWKAFSDCDMVILPVRNVPQKEKIVKSPNRLLESLMAGRFVVASPLPSYLEFGEYAWLGEEIADGITYALANPDEVRQKIADGQDYIEKHYSPEVISRKWEKILTEDLFPMESCPEFQPARDGSRRVVTAAPHSSSMTGSKNHFCPVCNNEGKPCGDIDVLAYYHRCEYCHTVWLSDWSEYKKMGKRVYEDYIINLDVRLAKLGVVAGYDSERMGKYRRLAERYFCLLHFLADNMGRRSPGPFSFIEIGFDLPSVFSCFHDYGYDVSALDIKIPEGLKRHLRPLVDGGRLHLIESDFESWEPVERFDILWMSHVLEHFEDTSAALTKIRSLLKPTGVAFISSPDAENLKEQGAAGLIGHMHPDQHLFMHSVGTFAQLCADAGLKVCFSERYGDPTPGRFEFVTKMEWRAIIVPNGRQLLSGGIR